VPAARTILGVQEDLKHPDRTGATPNCELGAIYDRQVVMDQ